MLVLGAFIVFGGLLLGLAALFDSSHARAQVGRSVDAISGMSLGGRASVDPARDGSFVDRVLQPGFLHAAHLGRRLSPASSGDRLARQLDRAGNPGRWNQERIYAAKIACLAVFAVFAGVLSGSSPAVLVIAAPAAAVAGFFLPNVLLYNAALKRDIEIRKSLPDALDLLTISVEAGLGFDAALSQVARNTQGPLAGEFFRVLQEMQIGKSRAAAFRALADRTDVPEMRSFVTSLVQADGFGIPIADVLREQASEMRIKRRQRAEERAQKVPVKILFPLVFFILPALFVVILGPGAIGIYDAFSN
jgi:tight adherence protein C